MSSSKPSAPTASSYHHYTDQRDHVLNCPEMYIGSCTQEPYQTRVITFDDNQVPSIIETTINVPQAVERLFLEVLSNASDNVDRSRRLNVDIGSIEVMMDQSTISITNGGVPIPIEIHPEFKVWVPQMIFGLLLSSSNYDRSVDRTGIGVNGLGAKLTNIFSHKFMVQVGDANRQLQYCQVWNDHMHVVGEPEITAYTGPSFVTISYQMDFSYFHYSNDIYPDEVFSLFARHCADISFTCKVPVTFNGIAFNFQDIKSYAQLYFGDQVNNSIIHYEWPDGTATVTRKGVTRAKDPNILPSVELCVIDTPDSGTCISFVNSMITRDGGVHVNAAYKAISSGILETVNNSGERSKKKGKNKSEEKTKRKALNIADVKPHVSMVLSCRLVNPKFTSQTKTALSSPTPKIEIPDKVLQPTMKWNLLDRLYAALEAKHFRSLTKTDGKKRRHISGILKLEDANLAGTKDSSNCTLYIVEGQSAMGYPVTAISFIPNGRDFIGVYPMQGKPLNVMNASPQQIIENKELCNLKQVLGLQEGVDYQDEANFQKLRYGHLIILTDSDTDGKHITGLILNFFHCRFPSLLARGYVMYLRTPIIRVWKGNTKYKFFTQYEYDTWKEQEKDYTSWKHKYYKGLGSSKKEDIQDDFIDPRVVVCVYDDSSPDAFRLAFDKKLSDIRKQWIAEYKPVLGVEDLQMQPISQFFYYEFVQYSISNVARSIPRLMDGLKESQRKIIWGAFCKWGSTKGNMHWDKGVVTGNIDEFKVGRFVGHISERTEYHHGEAILADTIVSMAHDFVGTNNLPFFCKDSQMGSRNMNGDDAANSRYTFTRANWWLPYVFKNSDMPLLTMVVDEGEEREPITFLPILPLELINGCNGIGSGHSTFIPNHNPLDVCSWYKSRIRGQPVPDILPWYRYFTGTIKVGIRANKKNDNTEDDPLDPDHIEPQGIPDESSDIDVTDNSPNVKVNEKLSMMTIGTFEQRDDCVIVNELPVGRCMHKYKQWLDKLIEEKKITDYLNRSTNDTAHFEIFGFKNPTAQHLRLQKSFGISNMVLLDLQNRPIKYNTVQDILEAFYQQRLPYYQARKQHIISTIQSQIDKHELKIRFIRAVIAKEIKVKNRKKAEVIAQMKQLNFPAELLRTTNLGQFTEDDILSLTNEINDLISQRTGYEQMQDTEFWLNDINEFETEYYKRYGVKPKEDKMKLKVRKE